MNNKKNSPNIVKTKLKISIGCKFRKRKGQSAVMSFAFEKPCEINQTRLLSKKLKFSNLKESINLIKEEEETKGKIEEMKAQELDSNFLDLRILKAYR